MVEILVVMIVIMILAGMLFIGGRAMIESNRKTSSRATLGNLRAMYTEREAAVGASKNKSDINTAIGASTTVGNVEPDSPARTGPAVTATRSAMALLLGVPANKKSIANLPTEQFLEGGVNPPVLLDGFGNPIIACPSTGLTGVSINGAAAQTITARDGKPFFASAGADGNFSLGDDNLYSFEN